MNSLVKDLFADFVFLFYPRYCLACHGPLLSAEKMLCTSCLTALPFTDFHLHDHHALHDRFAGRLPVQYVMALLKFYKKSRVQHMMHAIKYKGASELATALGRLYGNKLISSTLKYDFQTIIPVPLHASRLHWRGYNQSLCFAQGLAEQLNLPLQEQTLVRVARTDTQTRKSRFRRWANVEHVFHVATPELIRDHHVLLVDDVMTTGATLQACGEKLLQAGAAKISVCCMAAA